MGIADLTNVSQAKADLANDDASSTTSTATVQVGEHDLGQVADRLGVDRQALLQANPQIKDPSKLTAGQDIHLPEKGKSTQADSDDGSRGTKITDKGKDSGPKLYGDPLVASAMKGKLDGTQGGNTTIKDAASKDKDKHTLPPDEEAVRKAGGDQALKGYQQFKEATDKLSKNVHDTLVTKIDADMKDLGDLKKKLDANPSDPKTQIEYQRKLDQVQKEIDAVNRDPISQGQKMQQGVEKDVQETLKKVADEAAGQAG